MASLSGNTTAGESAWRVYVVDNPQRSTTDYQTEVAGAMVYKTTSPKDMSDRLGMTTNRENIRILSPTTFRVNIQRGDLSPNRAKSETCAQVRFRGQTGYLKLSAIRKPTSSGDAAETRTLNVTSAILDNLKDVAGVGRGNRARINIQVPGYGLVMNVSNIIKVPGTINGREPKADFAFTTSNNTQIFWISHKQGTDASAYQQYGGVTSASGSLTNRNIIKDDPEVVSFLSNLYDLYEDASMNVGFYPNNPFSNSRLNRRVYRPVGDPTLISRSVYGPDFGGNYGRDNVHMIGQGQFIFTPIVTPDGDITFQMTFSGPSEMNGVTGPFVSPTSDYRACFIASFRSGRRAEVGDRGTIPDVRIMIGPKKLAGSSAVLLDDVI